MESNNELFRRSDRLKELKIKEKALEDKRKADKHDRDVKKLKDLEDALVLM
jgi:hypothetical protein